MLRYCGVMVQVIFARGSPAWTAAQTFSTSAPWAARPSRSKSRRMIESSAAAAEPDIW